MTVVRLTNCRIAVFADHAPPHFHIIGNDGTRVSVDLETLTVTHGNARRYQEALDWAKANHEKLSALWATLNPKG